MYHGLILDMYMSTPHTQTYLKMVVEKIQVFKISQLHNFRRKDGNLVMAQNQPGDIVEVDWRGGGERERGRMGMRESE